MTDLRANVDALERGLKLVDVKVRAFVDALAQAAAERIRAAAAPCPVGARSFPEVDAADVLTLAALVKEPHTPGIAALVQGATGAAKHRHGKCHQLADLLRHLLESAKV